MGLIQNIEDALFSKLKAILGPFGKLIDFLKRLIDGFVGSYSKGLALAGKISSEITAWRNFRENINVKNRVISIPKAIDQTEQLIEQIRAAWAAIVDLAKQIKEQVKGGTGETDAAAEAEAAVTDLESGGFADILKKLPKLSKGLEKLLGVLALVVTALESIIAAIDDLTAIVDVITSLREEIETGSTIFLSQKNKRKTVTLEDGTKLKIRLGNLHS